jgi:hypothetical protein
MLRFFPEIMSGYLMIGGIFRDRRIVRRRVRAYLTERGYVGDILSEERKLTSMYMLIRGSSSEFAAMAVALVSAIISAVQLGDPYSTLVGVGGVLVMLEEHYLWSWAMEDSLDFAMKIHRLFGVSVLLTAIGLKLHILGIL